jgi:hypothetical protein
MSISLPDINLASVTVGQTGKLSFQQAGVSADPSFTQNQPKVRFHNESGSGLRISFNLSGDTFTLPAGAWKTSLVIPGESGYSWQVLYNLPNPPVTTLFTDYYYPNEPIPEGGVLGNSPIGIGGTIPVSNVTLSNEGNPINTLVIDMGPAGNLNVVQIWNDHFIWSVVQSGVSHTVLQGQTAGNPLLIGKSGDISEVLGNLLVDGTLNITGNSTLGGTTALNIVTVGGGLTFNGGDLTINGHNFIGINTFTAGMSLTSGDFALNTHNLNSVGSLNLGTGSLTRMSSGTYAGSTTAHTVNHLNGGTPIQVIACGGVSTGTQSIGNDTYTSTTFKTIEGFATNTVRFQALG